MEQGKPNCYVKDATDGRGIDLCFSDGYEMTVVTLPDPRMARLLSRRIADCLDTRWGKAKR